MTHFVGFRISSKKLQIKKKMDDKLNTVFINLYISIIDLESKSIPKTDALFKN